MKQTVNLYAFQDAFRTYGREHNFTYYGLIALFEYLEQYEEETGTELELDPVAFCCEFSEDTAETIINEHGLTEDFTEYCVNNDIEETDKEDAMNDFVRDYLTENTLYLGYVEEEGTHLYAAF